MDGASSFPPHNVLRTMATVATPSPHTAATGIVKQVRSAALSSVVPPVTRKPLSRDNGFKVHLDGANMGHRSISLSMITSRE